MKSSRYLIIVVVALFAVFIAFQYNKEEKSTFNKDGVKFKEEFESLNNKTDSNNNKKYPVIEIDESNPIKYSNYDEVFELLKSGTGIILLGYPESALTRNLAPILLEATAEVEIETVYYLNIKNDMDVLFLDENNKVVSQSQGTKNYKELLVQLDRILEENILIGSNGERIYTGKKKISIPTVIFVKDGDIVGYHVGTLESHEDPYELLDERQKEDLLIKLINLSSIVKGNTCDEKC